MRNSPVFAGFNTLNAKWYEIKLAKLLGKKSTVIDSGCKVTMAKWRNKYYLIDNKIIDRNEEKEN